MRKTYIALGCIVFAGLVACGENDSRIASVNGNDISKSSYDAYLELKRLDKVDAAKAVSVLDKYLQREALADLITQQPSLNKTKIDAELNELRKETLISRYFESYLQTAVSDEAVLNYYNTNASHYESKKVHVAHVLFRLKPNMGEAERQAKLTTAREAYSKIKAGSDFAEIAEQYSEDSTSRKKQGDLGWINEGAINKAFSQKVFSLEAGSISEPFESAYGFHIIKHIEGPLVVKQAFDTVKGRIRHQLRNESKDAEMTRLLALSEIKKD